MVEKNNFDTIKKALSEFSVLSFNDPLMVKKYSEVFGIRDLCNSLEADRILSINNDLERGVSPSESKPFEPEFDDLCRLHFIALSRRCLNILEFGSGFSTAVFADAMRMLSIAFKGYALENFRIETPFHVYAIEEEQRFLEITLNRLNKDLSKYATVSRSSLDVILHDNRMATTYSKLPNISPDLIYLDGPSQFGTTKEINGISFSNKSRMPISADILLIEFFLEPGTLIIVDGRTANARFLRSYLKRDWSYSHDLNSDIHYFELQEPPLGLLNKKKIEFCLNNKWLLEK